MPIPWSRRSLLWCFATPLVVACGEPPQVLPPDATVLDASLDAAPHRAELLGTSSFTEDGRTWTEERYRIVRPDGRATYVQWIASDRPGPRPLVVAIMPYAGIDWTGEEVDTRWAAYPLVDGLHTDVDGPGFDGSARIVYEPAPLARIIDESRIHRLNDCHTLLVYGRFYAGGAVRDDIADMAAGMWFAAERGDVVDRARVGVFGGSWGGFEALYAAAHADPRLPATVVSAMYPPSDFETWYQHATSRTGAASDFLAPYTRRVTASTGGPPGQGDFAGLRAADLCAGLPDDTLLLHDAHDNLVPIAQSRALVATCGAQLVTWPRVGALDPSSVSHGPLLQEPAPVSVYTYATAFLHLRLAPPQQANVIEVVSAAALRAHLTLVRAAQVRGEDVSGVAPRLVDLADPRLWLVDDAATPRFARGAEVVAAAVNAVWGTHYTAADVRQAMAIGLPPV